MALFQNFRAMYEPFNYNRKIIGFDTFSGFPEMDQKDQSNLSVGDYSVPENYELYLDQVLNYHESESPIPHKKKIRIN